MQKSKSLRACIAVIWIVLSSSVSCVGAETLNINYDENIRKYIDLLEQNPENCHYAEQIAGSFQALNQFRQAIKYYTRAITLCSDNYFNTFQLGVCHYLLLDRLSILGRKVMQLDAILYQSL